MFLGPMSALITDPIVLGSILGALIFPYHEKQSCGRSCCHKPCLVMQVQKGLEDLVGLQECGKGATCFEAGTASV